MIFQRPNLKAMLARQPADLWRLLACYLAAWGFYRFMVGIPFDAGILNDMHFLPLDTLQEHLFSSLLYLHAQPPLMNLLAGLALKISQPHHAILLEALYIAAGIATITLCFYTMMQLGVARLPRCAICFVLCVFPTLFFYQSWAYTAHLELAACAAAMYCLAMFYTDNTNRKAYLIWLFALCCFLGLLHSRWHLAVFLGLAALMWLVENKGMRRQIALVSVLCLLPLAAWYSKNLIMFDFFGPSSWMGTNIVQMAEQITSPQDRSDLIAAGDVSPEFPAEYDMAKITKRAPQENMRSDAPALRLYKFGDWPNYNYPGLLVSSRQDMRDAIAVLGKYPSRYVDLGFYKIKASSMTPSLAYPNLQGLPILIGYVTHQPPPTNYPIGTLPQWLRDVMSATSVALYLVVPGIMLLMVPFMEAAHRRFTLCALYLIAVMLVIACFFNGWEQERMRWSLEPFYLTLLALALDSRFQTRSFHALASYIRR